MPRTKAWTQWQQCCEECGIHSDMNRVLLDMPACPECGRQMTRWKYFCPVTPGESLRHVAMLAGNFYRRWKPRVSVRAAPN